MWVERNWNTQWQSRYRVNHWKDVRVVYDEDPRFRWTPVSRFFSRWYQSLEAGYNKKSNWIKDDETIEKILEKLPETVQFLLAIPFFAGAFLTSLATGTISFTIEVIKSTVNQVLSKNAENYDQILRNCSRTALAHRKRNIDMVNRFQDQILASEWFYLMIRNLVHRDSRTLVIYYRWSQMDEGSQYMAIEIMRFLRYYVENGYSTLFDSFAVVYRHPENELLQEFRDCSLDVKGVEFEIYTSLYANVVHFSDGTPNFLPGTLPILTNAPIKRWKMRDVKANPVSISERSYVHLPLSFVNTDWAACDESDFEKDNKDYLIKTLLTIQRCEKRMISIAKKYFKKSKKASR